MLPTTSTRSVYQVLGVTVKGFDASVVEEPETSFFSSRRLLLRSAR